METILINEQELNEMLISKAEEMRKNFETAKKEVYARHGLTGYEFVNGLEGTRVSPNLDLETNINNLLATFSHNYADCLGHQARNFVNQQVVQIIGAYLESKDLLEDFKSYRDKLKNNKVNN